MKDFHECLRVDQLVELYGISEIIAATHAISLSSAVFAFQAVVELELEVGTEEFAQKFAEFLDSYIIFPASAALKRTIRGGLRCNNWRSALSTMATILQLYVSEAPGRYTEE